VGHFSEKWPITRALVYDEQSDTLAQDAGFRARDVIVKVGPNQVQGLEDLKHMLNQSFDEYEAGTRVKFGTGRLYYKDGWQRADLYSKLGH
jgi:hypothetical protein